MATRNANNDGTVEKIGRSHYIRFRIDAKLRPRFKMGDNLSPAMLAEKTAYFRENRERLIAIYLEERAKKEPKAKRGESVKDIGTAWTSGELFRTHGPVNGLREKASAEIDAYRFAKYVYPTLGDKPAADVTPEDVQAIFAGLPEQRASTRMQIHSMLHMLFSLAEYPLRLRPEGSNPVKKWMRPAKDKPKLYSFLYPTELLALLGTEKVPLARRVLYTLACYTGLRKSSLLALRWRDIDVEHKTIRSLVNKNGVPQLFSVSDDLIAALVRWREVSGGEDGDRIVVGLDCPKGKEARALRDDLRLAKVERAELFPGYSEHVEPLRFHDWRATFVTWAKRAGWPDSKIQDRTGHLTKTMLDRYARQARTLADLNIDPFPPIGTALAWDSDGPSEGPKANGPAHGAENFNDSVDLAGIEPATSRVRFLPTCRRVPQSLRFRRRRRGNRRCPSARLDMGNGPRIGAWTIDDDEREFTTGAPLAGLAIGAMFGVGGACG